MYTARCGLQVPSGELSLARFPATLAFHVGTTVERLTVLGTWLTNFSSCILLPARASLPALGEPMGQNVIFAFEMENGGTTDVCNIIAGVFRMKAPQWSQTLQCAPQTTGVRSLRVLYVSPAW